MNIPLKPTPAMIEAGAQRLVKWENNSIWPHHWTSIQIMAAQNDAERVWRSMWLEAQNNKSDERNEPNN